MKTLIYLALTLAAATALAAAAEYKGPGVAGIIGEDTTWRNEVFVAGDVELAPDVTLTVEPGTRVTIARRDALSRTFLIHGKSRKVEFNVAGALVIKGTADAPVVFVPEADGSTFETWQGFRLKEPGSMTATYSWFVGSKYRLPKEAELAGEVYRIIGTRKRGAIFWPYYGEDAAGKNVYFYPDGTLVPKEVIKKNRGFSRWIIAPCFTLVGSGFASLFSLNAAFTGDEVGAYAIMIIIPPISFALGYLIGYGIDKEHGVVKAQRKWLTDHPDFAPPF